MLSDWYYYFRVGVNGSVWGLFLGYLRMMNVSGEVI